MKKHIDFDLEPLVLTLLTKSPGMTAAAISDAVNAPLNTVKNYLTRTSKVFSKRQGNLYFWHRHISYGTSAMPNQIDKMKGVYTCPELRRNPGLTDDRFVAFSLPSLVNGKQIQPRRKV